MNHTIDEARRLIDEWEKAFEKREGDWWERGPDALEAALDSLAAVEGNQAQAIAGNVRSTVERKWLSWASNALDHGNVEEPEADFLLLSFIPLIPESANPKEIAKAAKRLMRTYWHDVRKVSRRD